MHKIDNEITHKIILVLLITVTIMIQNPLEPMFKGILGKFQIFDIIFPISILFIFKNIYKNLFNRFNFSDRLANILPLPQPISKILDFLLSLICFNKKLLIE